MSDDFDVIAPALSGTTHDNRAWYEIGLLVGEMRAQNRELQREMARLKAVYEPEDGPEEKK